MRQDAASAFASAIEDLTHVIRTARRNGVNLTSHKFYAPKAREGLAQVRKSFLLLPTQFPRDRFPDVTLLVTGMQPVMDQLLANFPARPDEMLKLLADLHLMAKADLAAAIDVPEVQSVVPVPVPFVPEEVLDERLGLFRKVLAEVNRCYESACYNACATLIRRLVESLIVEAFESRGVGAKIKNSSGEFYELNALIGLTTNESSFSLTRGTKTALPRLKFFGDLGAHGRRHLVVKSDLDREHDAVRLTIEELGRLVRT